MRRGQKMKPTREWEEFFDALREGRLYIETSDGRIVPASFWQGSWRFNRITGELISIGENGKPFGRAYTNPIVRDGRQ